MERPFALRVLIEEWTRIEGNARIEISAPGLRDEDGQKLPRDHVSCHFQTQVPSLLLSSIKDQAKNRFFWLCQSGSYSKVVSEFARFSPLVSEFIYMNGKRYRGAIDLFVQGQKIQIVNELNLETYLAGLVNKEIRSDFPMEAVKAQVVAARSYALAVAADRRANGLHYDVLNTQADQVYDGAKHEDARAFKAVEATHGEVLLSEGEVLKAYYHASSGGFSELPHNAWETRKITKDHRAYAAQASPWDKDTYQWSVVVAKAMGMMWKQIGTLSKLQVIQLSEGQRAKRIFLEGSEGSQSFSGQEFRKLLGPGWLKSLNFEVHAHPSGWELKGKGWGHGVGLSQIGAKNMAKAGKSYREILQQYYPGADLKILDLDVKKEPAKDLSIQPQVR